KKDLKDGTMYFARRSEQRNNLQEEAKEIICKKKREKKVDQ
ncbi:MAG: hypothetical protein ACI8RD_006481, partial [Bacillariaceae sp.]